MTDQLNKITDEQCKNPPAKHDDLSVPMLNCTLSRSPLLSHTDGFLQVAEHIYQANDCQTEILRSVDYDIATGLGKNMADTAEWDIDD